MKRYRGPEGQKAKYEYIDAVVQEHGIHYEGPVIFIPSSHQLAESIEQSAGFFYCNPMESYEEKNRTRHRTKCNS
jgi:hypothetical protein